MAILVTLEDIGHEWPGKPIFSHQSLGINEGDRIGIVGRNGEGKSTLLSLIAKQVEPDEGSVTWRNGISVGVLGQTDSLTDSNTVLTSVVGDIPEYEWAGNPQTREIMKALLEDIDLQSFVGELSGGQRRRVDLARLFIERWDILALDEPTNHLDVVAINWLANHLKSRWPKGQGALLVVTHDRWFLDEVATSMLEVHDKQIESFEGGFSAYVQQRVERDRVAAVREERRQSMLRKELAWLSRGAQARTSKAKFRIDAAQELIADVPPLRNPIELKRMAVSRLGKQVLEFTNVSFAYTSGAASGHLNGSGQTSPYEIDRFSRPDEGYLELGAYRNISGSSVIKDLNWIIGPGDRIGILGKNGAGKSTLLQLMVGQFEPTTGRVKIGKSVKFGVLSQRLDTFKDRGDWTVRNILTRAKSHVVVDGKETSSEKLLERLGFAQSEFMSRIDDLSGGQQRRLALLLVLLEEPNVLILDEPGNDLDTDMLAAVEDLLDSWPGTLIVVTHDRHFIERVTDDLYALIDGSIRHLPRGVDEYLELSNSSQLEEDQSNSSSNLGSSVEHITDYAQTNTTGCEKGNVGSTEDPSSKMSNTERREAKKRFDSITRRLEKAQAEPERIQAELNACDPSDYEELLRLQAELKAANDALDELETEWIELSDMLGE